MTRPNQIPCIPENAPFSTKQRAWLNGYLAGIFQSSETSQTGSNLTHSDRPAEVRSLNIFFGSQTGTAEQLAKKLGTASKQRGYSPRVLPLNQLSAVDKSVPLFVLTSTWGDGDPPDNAVEGWRWLQELAPGEFVGVKFAVLGLGDKNYSDFCGAGRKFDQRLETLGGSRLTDRIDCDLDYEGNFTKWMESLWPVLEGLTWSSPLPISASSTPTPEAAPAPSPVCGSKGNPYPARLQTNRRLNSPGSSKDTRHFEILLGDSGLTYEPGDALGVFPRNCPVLVEELLASLGFRGEEPVPDGSGGVVSLHEAFMTRFTITSASSALAEHVCQNEPDGALAGILAKDGRAGLESWLKGRDSIDLVRGCTSLKWDPSEFCSLLRPLQPRLYSISSSFRAHPGEVHLTVATVRYELHGRSRKGVSSCWLADRVVPGETPVPLFFHKTPGFKLPSDTSRPVIMVGPGTGIAPFRAFLEERRATGAAGRNWLFFGDQRRDHDFLYQDEISAMQKDGFLHELELAFSRDQAEKIYVQDRMLARAADLWEWLESGAHFYVCGDAKRMARDVDQALVEVIRTAGGKSGDAASEYVARMREEKRYQRDVY